MYSVRNTHVPAMLEVAETHNIFCRMGCKEKTNMPLPSPPVCVYIYIYFFFSLGRFFLLSCVVSICYLMPSAARHPSICTVIPNKLPSTLLYAEELFWLLQFSTLRSLTILLCAGEKFCTDEKQTVEGHNNYTSRKMSAD